MIDPVRFHDPDYNAALVDLLGHAVACEAPLAEDLLVQGIARAHGFRKAGRIIRDRIVTLTTRHFHIETDQFGRRFVWPDRHAPLQWFAHRPPASDDDIRQIDQIALQELHAAVLASETADVPVEVARRFGIGRLSITARARIEAAIEEGAP